MSDPCPDEPLPLVAANVTVATSSDAPSASATAVASAAHATPPKRRLYGLPVPLFDEPSKRIRYTDSSSEGTDSQSGCTSPAAAYQRYQPTLSRLSTPPPLRDAAMANRPVNRRTFKMAGPYILGQPIDRASEQQLLIKLFLAKRHGTDDFVLLKMLALNDSDACPEDQKEELQSKLLLRNELAMLSLLVGCPGVVQLRGWFKDTAYDQQSSVSKRAPKFTGRICPRIVLVLENVWSHDFDDASHDYVSLQQLVDGARRLTDRVALPIFRSIVVSVERMHRLNIVHRNLNLANIQLHRPTNRTIITNFAASRMLHAEDELLYEHGGRPDTISPEMAKGHQSIGRPNDMWSLGVLLYHMVVGKMPFCDTHTVELTSRIKAGVYRYPASPVVSTDMRHLISGLLNVRPIERLTATAVLALIDNTLAPARRRCKASEQSVPLYVPPPPPPPAATGRDARPQSLIVERSTDTQTSAEYRMQLMGLADEQLVPDIDAPVVPARVRPRVRQSILKQASAATATATAARRVWFLPDDQPDYRLLASVRPGHIHTPSQRQHATRRTAATAVPAVPPQPTASGAAVYARSRPIIGPANAAAAAVIRIVRAARAAASASSMAAVAWPEATSASPSSPASRPDRAVRATPAAAPASSASSAAPAAGVSRVRRTTPLRVSWATLPSATAAANSTHPAGTTPSAAFYNISLNALPTPGTVDRLFQSVNESFLGDLLPLPPSQMPLRPFDGRVTPEFSAAVRGWLLDKYADNSLVATVFGGGVGSDDADAVARVCGFLTSCGVVLRNENGLTVVLPDQSNGVRIFMTLLLQAIGLSGSLFVSG